jgi:hypothetical protein
MISFRSPAEIVGRLELPAAAQVLLLDAPEELEEILAGAAVPDQSIRSATVRKIRSAKEAYDLILLWQESRVGSRAALEGAVKRLAPGGRLWVVTAMKKVMGPRTPAMHRLELEDLRKAFARDAMVCDREARLSAWHTAYRFVRKPPGKID